LSGSDPASGAGGRVGAGGMIATGGSTGTGGGSVGAGGIGTGGVAISPGSPGTFVNWTPSPVPASWPSGRRAPAAAYDHVRKKIVMFGGYTGGSNDQTTTWEWDGLSGTWTARTAATSPPGSESSMVYDEATGRMLLFGGGVGPQDYDFWEWDGAAGTWTDLTPSTLPLAWPPSRVAASVVYDTARGRMIIFGGFNNQDGYFQDLWEWNSTTRTWTNRTPSPLPREWPSVREYAAMVYDSRRNRVELVGGTVTGLGAVVVASDVLEWNGDTGTWTNRGPSPFGTNAMVRLTFDAGRGKVLLFGGSGCGSIVGCSDAWEWDGTTATWTNRTPSTLPTAWPPSRTDDALVYDVSRGRVFVFGGWANNPPLMKDLWEWNGAD